ncbi:Phthiocerol synthesis polyketide synthase type I PpsC [Enhygromyxa salina]|uniref:Phthiocerol synthesis polyketide synthase type I PpsC n=1 Tax=Enhygromyxa salina TaxID=215803 RepID=A0A2S9YGD5_9BACT|nr:type I polyketide synthase [Enhygromyxa salina]PRQ04170.1 Phthiocerol synthesis polyketide synthase type I PpsC [Enhygromyxa salina]
MTNSSVNRPSALQRWILDQVAELMDVAPERIAPDRRLRDQGLDSVLALALLAKLEAHVGRSLSTTVPWRYPTVKALANYLEGGATQATHPADLSVVADEPVAIVGLGCRFPGANSPEAFWRLLHDGVDAVTEVPIDRWDSERWYNSDPAAAGKSATRWGGFLDQVDRFDPAFFGISPRETREMDPQQRIFLEVAWEALESGGVIPRSLVDSATAVFAGAMWNDWDRVVGDDPTRIQQHSATGHDPGIIAGRLSYLLGVRGPSLTVNTACSSSLVAIHLAVQSLQRGECTRALAGAVNLMLSPLSSVAMSKFGAMAPDGRCKAFDARANGYVRGEGVGVVMLEPLSLALERGAPIYALIRGSAINNDGYSNGLTAPSGDAQEAVLARAWAVAGIPPAEVDFVETHGPGTYLGDPIEAESVGAVFGPDREEGDPLLIGSVKTNLGHLEAAAGMAGLIKTTLALHHGVIPPNLHFETPNPHIDFDRLRLQVPTQPRAWPQRERARLAGVSSFGFGGTNAHLALESAPGALRAASSPTSDEHEGRRAQPSAEKSELVFVFSGHGGQWLGMGQALLHREPKFRAAVESCDAALRPLIGWSTLQHLCSREPQDSPDVIQPLLFTIQVALSRTLAAHGVHPDAVIGQSIGEVAAAHIAGHLSLEDAAAVIAARARLAAAHLAGAGAVMVVRLGLDKLGELPPGLSIAGKIAPSRTLVAGDPSSLEAAQRGWEAEGVRCARGRVGYASHSAHVEPILGELEAALATITPRAGTVAWWSTTNDGWAPAESAGASYWARNLRQPFDLLNGLRELGRGAPPVFIEIGPHPVLGAAIRETMDGPVEALACVHREQDEYEDLHALLDTLRGRGLVQPVAPRGATLVPVTATSAEALDQAALELREHLARNPEVPLADLGWTLLHHRPHHRHRAAVVVEDRESLARGLAQIEGSRGAAASATPVVHRGQVHDSGKIAFVFPGQGGQWIGMGRVLLERAPAFAEALDACDAALRPETGWSVREILRGAPGAPSLERIEVVQPALWAVMVSLAALWRSWGIEPDLVIGHSQGEIAAACVAGALSLADGARVVARRSRLLLRIAGRGAMAAIGLGLEALMELLPDELSLAVVNDGESSVVAGAPEAVAAWVEQLRERDIFARMVDVDIASHSPQVDALRGFLHFEFRELAPVSAKVPIVSTVFDREFAGEELDGSYWIENLRRPVRFDRALRRAIDAGARTFIEVSPHPLLTGVIERALADAEPSGAPVPPGTAVASLRRNHNEVDALLDSLAALFVAGVAFDARSLMSPGKIAPLPTSVFNRERFWPPPASPARSSGPRPTAKGGWVLALELDLRRQPWLADHRVHGEIAVPGIAMIAWMRQVIARVPGTWEVDGAVLEAPLVLDRSAREVQISAQRDGEDYVVELFAAKAEAWVRHARARLVLNVEFPAGEMPALDEASAEPPPYAAWAAAGNNYGPTFRGIERLIRDDDTIIADLALPETVDPQGLERGVHPALLDAALQTLLIDAPTDQANALFTANLRLFRTQAKRVRVLASRPRGPLSGDLTLWDRSDGGLLAQINDVSLLPVERDDLEGSAPVGALRLIWRPLPPIDMVAGSDRCVVVVDAITPLGEELRELLDEAGAEVDLVLRTDLAQALSSAADTGPRVHVIALWTTPEGPGDEAAVALTRAAVDELRMVVDAGATSTWITCGAQAIEGHPGSPALAALWGLARVLQREHPELRHRVIDLAKDESIALLSDAILVEDHEDQVAIVGGRRLIRRLVPTRETREASWSGGRVLITGGAGFVGRQLARWLIEEGGAQQVILASRSEPSPAAREQFEELGEAIRFVRCDVTDRAALEALLASLPALTGVIHGAMALRDAPLATLTSEQIAEVMAPKVRGALLLHELCRDHAIERFVLLSSMASVLGNPGQGAYAAANAFLDTLAEQRHAAGLPAQSQSWGIWTNQSQRLREQDRERFRRSGVRPLDVGEGIEWFASAWTMDAPHLVLVPVDWDQFSRSLTWTPPLVEELVTKIVPAPSAPREREVIENLAALERIVETEIREILGLVHGLVHDVGFAEQGMDSLMAVTLKGRLEQRLDLNLSATIAFNYPTLPRLVRHLGELLGLASDQRVPREIVASDHAAIAVVGMACRFPGADSVADLWSMLLASTDAVGPIPSSRFDIEPWYDPDPDAPGRTYTREAGLIDEVDAFDLGYFRISPREAQTMDPQQGLLLEVSVSALEDSGVAISSLEETAAGVFVGALNYDHGAKLLGRAEADWVDGFTASGTRSSVLSGRLSHFLGVHGPSLTVDTACSSSMTAIHLAVRSLRAGECDLAIAGGVNALLSPLTLVERSKNRMLSPTGRCRPFDVGADGIAIGEGCGMVVLKRLSDAMLAGDRIRAIIRGSALNHDGRTSGLTVPNGLAQRALLRAAITEAGVQPEEVGYVEAHGTGTSLGDPIELESLAKAMRLADDTPLWIGSLKANLGHLESASGVAGFIKTVLALEQRMIPPQIHFDRGNPMVPWDTSPLRVPLHATDLHSQFAGVSSFGFSGTNVHVILERGLSVEDHEPPLVPSLLTLSARDPNALDQLRERWIALLAGEHPPLADLCYTAAHRRGQQAWRLAAAGDDASELAERLRAAPTIHARRSAPALVFVFAGQSGVYRGMGRALLESSVEVRRIIEDIDGLIQSLGGPSVLDALQDAELDATELAQPALFALEVGLVTWFASLGVRPAAVVGHSVGEIAAAWACGALPLFEACHIVAMRATVMAELRGSGAMLAVAIGPDEVAALGESDVSVAAINGPAACVLAGPSAALERIRAGFSARGRFARWVSTDYAFHSPAVIPASFRLKEFAGSVETTPAEVPFYSTVDGGRRHAPLDLDYWVSNMCEPVRFAAAIGAIADDMDAVFVELGPHPALQIPIAQVLGERGAGPDEARSATIPTLRRDGNGRVELAEAAGRLHALGVALELERLVPRANVSSLPAYPWQRQRHRLPDAPQVPRGPAGTILVAPTGWTELVRLDQPRPTWEARPVAGDQLDAGALIPLLLALVDAPVLNALMAASSEAIRRVHVSRTRAGVEVWADDGQGWRELLNANVGVATALDPWSSDVAWEPCPRSVLEAELAHLDRSLGPDVLASDRGQASWRLHLDGVSTLRAFELARSLASLIHGEPRVLGGWGRLQGRATQAPVAALVVTHTKIVMFDRDERELLLVETTQWDPDHGEATPRSPELSAPSTALLAELEQLSATEREDALADWIEREARAALMIEDELPRDEGLFSLGMDSLLAISLLGSVSAALGVSLPNTLVFEHPSVSALARAALAQVVLGEPAAAPAPLVASATATAEDLRAEDARPRPRQHPAPDEAIAIVGVACRLPGADSPDAFWSLLEAGADAISTVPADRWDAEAWTDPDPDRLGRMVSAAGGFLDDLTQFDPAFFGISPREAERMDPQQRLLLEVAHEALEQSGWPAMSLRGSRTGVFVGIGTEDFGQLKFHGGPAEDIGAYDFTGTDTSVAAGRLSHTWGLEGPSMAIDTACSSSLVALHLAATSLRLGECERALVGGVNVMLAPELGVFLSRNRAMSPSGRCRTFDVAADGYVRGEGCVVLALRRLSEAERAGDRILALIRGSAVLHDGHASGLTVPNPASQAAVIRAALERARVEPNEVSMIEAHGTGTPLGDPIEVRALTEVFGGRAERLWLGSHKTNLGHLEAAAGITGVLKVVLALRHGVVPPHLNLDTLNPDIDLAPLRAEIPRRAVAWEPRAGRRLAGVSSFGFSGTNVHIVLEQAPPSSAPAKRVTAAPARVSPRPWLIPVSARSPAASTAWARALADRVAASTPTELSDIVATLGSHRDHHRLRTAVVGELDELPGLLRDAQTIKVGRRSRLVFVFSGQGSHALGMARELHAEAPSFRAAFDAIADAFEPTLGWSLRDELNAPEANSRLDRAEVVQPLLCAIQIALARLLEGWGLRPDAVLGHSIGEVAAAVTSGALGLADAGRVIESRSRLVAEQAPAGGMAVVELSRAEAEAELDDELHIAAVNGPQTVLLAGAPEALDRFGSRIRARGRFFRRVAIGYASHSPGMDVLVEPLQAALSGLRPQPATTTMYSTVRARAVTGAELDPSYWSDNLRAPVRFDEVVLELLSRGPVTFVEIGPHPVLGYGVKQWCEAQDSRGETRSVCLPSLRHDLGDRRSMLELVGRLYERGHDPDWSALNPEGSFIELPTYPWDRQRYWPATGPARSSSEGRVVAEAGNEGVRVLSIELGAQAWLADHRVGALTVVPGAAYSVWARRAVGAHDGELELRELEIEAALTLADDEQVELQAVCRVVEPGLWDAEILSAKGGAWIRHARARLIAGAPAEAAADRRVDLAKLRERCPELVPGEALYARMAADGLRYGPAFRGIVELRVGAGEALAELRATEEVAREGSLHPAWVDAAQHAAALLLPPGRWLPVGVESLVVHGPPPSRAFVHASLREPEAGESEARHAVADLVVHTVDGATVATMRGLRLARVESQTASPDDLRLFEDTWLRAPAVEGARAPSGRWLICGGEDELASTIAEALRERGVDEITRVDGSTPPTPAELEGATSIHLGTEALDELWRPLQHLARAEAGPAKVALVTRGAWSIEGRDPDASEPINPSARAAWGLGRTLRHELPQWDLSLIDLALAPRGLAPRGRPSASIEAMLDHLLADDDERELVLRDNERWVGRWRGAPIPPAPPQRIADAEGRAFRLTCAQPGDLGSLALRELERGEPGRGEVEIAIEAAGVSFSDVLKAHGLYPGVDGPPPLGVECSGRIARLGPEVVGWSVGDPVIAILTGGGFGSHAITPASLLARRPVGLSATAAATLPGAFLTAFHALVTLAEIGPKDRLLIHSASGGVGQAALQIALDLGAEVYGTAGTPDKRALLVELGCRQAWSSRSHEWFEGLREATDGEGVDIVLNTLPGEDLRLGVEILRSGGRFLEIGRTDIYADRRLGMAVFRKNVAFFAIDVGEPALLASGALSHGLRELVKRVEAGRLQPLPARVWPIERGADALREMARARHTGKLVLQVSDPEADPGAAGRIMLPVAGSAELGLFGGTWLITGGTGALGLRCAELLVGAGVGRLVLVARRPPSAASEAAITALRARGAELVFAACDVANRDALAELVGAHEHELEGVIHCAGVLDDALLRDLDDARFARVIAAKVHGARHLDELTRELPLMHFVLFSSLSGVLGSPGQSAYALANAYLDGLAAARRGQGLPALSVAWGAWRDIGLAAGDERRGARLARRGLPSLTPDAGTDLLARLLTSATTPASVSATPLDWPAYRDAQPDMARTPRFALIEPESAAAGGPATSPSLSLEALLSDTHGARERQRELARWIAERAATVLGVAAAQISHDQPLAELGLDSLMSLELRNQLQTLIPPPLERLPSTLLFTFPTIGALAEHLLELVTPAAAKSSEPGKILVTPAATNPTPAEHPEVEHASDDEVMAALLRELAEPVP